MGFEVVHKKKAQAAGTAVLLAIVAGLLLMFIVLIPPQERADLLGERASSSSEATTTSVTGGANLLKESPGRVDFLAQDTVEHPLPVINVFTATEGKVLAEKTIAYAKRGVFSEEVTRFTFPVSDVSNTNNVLLTLKSERADDHLIIYLNDELLFKGPAEEAQQRPIALSTSALQGTNTLIFAVSSPGLAFWKTNELTVRDIKIIADVTSTDAQSSRNVFLISETEKRNMEKITLKFQPACKFDEVGKLSVRINGREVYEGIPDCDLALVPIEFAPELLEAGENEIVFSAERGVYLLSHMMLVSRLKEVDFPTYYFELTAQQYKDVRDERNAVRLKLDFVDVVAAKRGEIQFNGHVKHFDTRDASYNVDISDDVVEGTNALKLRPKKTLEIRELRVDLVR